MTFQCHPLRIPEILWWKCRPTGFGWNFLWFWRVSQEGSFIVQSRAAHPEYENIWSLFFEIIFFRCWRIKVDESLCITQGILAHSLCFLGARSTSALHNFNLHKVTGEALLSLWMTSRNKNHNQHINTSRLWLYVPLWGIHYYNNLETASTASLSTNIFIHQTSQSSLCSALLS